ncbi:MAG: hypothetical protein GY869_15150 [Planctomycetes bacterium]|nr:hypothetical protein [Planctomycetota bacterium]
MKALKGKILIVLLVSCASGAGSFYVTRSIEEEKSIVPDQTVKQWLDLSEQQHQDLQQSVTDFHFTAADLAYDYQNERRNLVQLLSDSQITDQQILDQIETVIQANDQLFREVVGYVLSVRQYLTPQQHQRLMQLCNKVIDGEIDRQSFRSRNARLENRQIREPQRGLGFNRSSPYNNLTDPNRPLGRGRGLGPGQGRGLGSGQGRGVGSGQGRDLGFGQGRGLGPGQGRGLGPGQTSGQNQGMRRGQGQGLRVGGGEGMSRGEGMGNQGMGRGSRGQAGRQGQGRGQGQGNRPRGRGRGNFSRRMNFDTSQTQLINQLDPEFNQQSFEISGLLQDYYHQLAILLADPNTSEDAAWEHLENLLEMRNQLDRRIARHVLLIRPHLTPQQLNILIGLSKW